EGGSNIGKAFSFVLVHKPLYNSSFGVAIAIASGIIIPSPSQTFSIGSAFIWFMIFLRIASSIFFLLVLNKASPLDAGLLVEIRYT
ncbi:MAG: hypothetical protein ACPL07_04070, partial [Candidatus Bathyarchaeia archaeon]